MKRPASRLLVVSVFAGVLASGGAGRASAPAGHYAIANGAVYDTKTKLTWQQAASSSTYTQPAAASYCATLGLNGATWRLPTMKELLTIVDLSVSPPGPTIDSTAFPGTPPDYFWSSTPYAGAADSAWGVYFNNGYTDYNGVSIIYSVRCVR